MKTTLSLIEVHPWGNQQVESATWRWHSGRVFGSTSTRGTCFVRLTRTPCGFVGQSVQSYDIQSAVSHVTFSKAHYRSLWSSGSIHSRNCCSNLPNSAMAVGARAAGRFGVQFASAMLGGYCHRCRSLWG